MRIIFRFPKKQSLFTQIEKTIFLFLAKIEKIIYHYCAMASLPSQLLVLFIPYLALVVIETTPLKEFHVPIIGFVTFCYLLYSFFVRKANKGSDSADGLPTSVIIVFLVLSVISLTGGTGSLFFFLLYFVAFLLAFTAPPEAVFIYAALTVFYYLFLEGKGADSFALSLRLISLALLSPLAYFFGKEYQEREAEKQAAAKLAEDTAAATANISDDVKEVLAENRATMSEESIERLNDILEETQEINAEVRTKDS